MGRFVIVILMHTDGSIVHIFYVRRSLVSNSEFFGIWVAIENISRSVKEETLMDCLLFYI